jgi:UDP:flavonoid glycosyltransferase YjiC (YdhE family)
VRILFTFAGGAGHFEPLVPIARAAAAAGHAVAFTCAARMVPLVARRGFAAVATAPGELGPPERRPLVPVDRDREQRVLREYYGGSLKRERAAGIAARCAAWRPDALVCDEADFGCADAARELGLPLAIVLVGAPGLVPPDLAMEGLVLSPFPERYRPGAVQRFRAHDAAVSAGLRDLEVFVSVGADFDPAELGSQPPNIRVARYVDQGEVLPRCGAVISHGGSGTVLAALAHGLPSVLLPIGADQPQNADRCEQLGVARVLDAVRATPTQVHNALEGVAECRPAAARLQREIARLPAPEKAVTALEAYA